MSGDLLVAIETLRKHPKISLNTLEILSCNIAGYCKTANDNVNWKRIAWEKNDVNPLMLEDVSTINGLFADPEPTFNLKTNKWFTSPLIASNRHRSMP